MALVKCKECGNDVSNSAKSCPKCGSNMYTPKGGWFSRHPLLTVFLVTAGVWITATVNKVDEQIRQDAIAAEQAEAKRVAALTPEQRQAEADTKAKEEAAKKKKDDEWAGAVTKGRMAIDKIKQRMNNPGSFELVEAYTKNGYVCMKIRGANAFNALVVNEYIVDPFLQVNKPSATQWNKHCAGKGFTDIAGSLRLY